MPHICNLCLTRVEFPERALTGDEISWLKKKCPYFKDAYISYLSTFKFKPTEQVTITFVPLESAQNWGQIEIEVHGLWVETILYEIPLMATLSEAFFRTVDTAWTLEGQEGLDKYCIPFHDVSTAVIFYLQSLPIRRD